MNFSVPIHKLTQLASAPKLQRHLRLALSVLLLAILMSILAQWTWLLVPTQESEGTGDAHPHPTGHTQQSAASPLQSIAVERLWGTLPPAAPALSVTQETRLPLSLRGTLSGLGLALIETSGNTKVYRIGENLPGGVLLKDVLNDHVLIERAGIIERLALPKQTLGNPNMRPTHNPTVLAPSVSADPPANLGKLLQQSPAELSKEFRLSPAMEGGKLRGYRLRALRSPEMLQRAGLEADDILISVNGTSLTQANDLPKFIKELRTATTLDAVVLRNGSEIPLHLDLSAN
ncbi:MAG: type II secretion system protein N [Halothiobacillaceae bacterium]|nr:type II secretion system protein N [Halothiobacillaceae bacterium]